MGEDHPDVLEYLALLVGSRHLHNQSLLEPKTEPIAREGASASVPQGE
jgi:hypothetical protein